MFIYVEASCHTQCFDIICENCGYTVGRTHFREEALYLDDGSLSRWDDFEARSEDCPMCETP